MRSAVAYATRTTARSARTGTRRRRTSWLGFTTGMCTTNDARNVLALGNRPSNPDFYANVLHRFKQAMWEMVAKEMGLPWRAIEGIHWEMGREEMASRANVPVFQPHAGGAMPRTQSSPGPRTTPNLAPAPETPGDSSGGDQRAASEFSNHSPPELSNRSPPLALNRSPPHQAPNRTPPSISNRSPRAASGRTPRLRSTSTGTVNRRRRRSTNTRRDAPPQLAPVTESGPPVPQTSTFSPSYSDVPTPLSSAMDWNGSPATRPTADDRLPLPPLHLRRPSPELVYQPPPIPPVPRLPPQYRREDT